MQVAGFVSGSGIIHIGNFFINAVCRYGLSNSELVSKFFTFVVTLNAVGILLAALNVWTYPRHYTGAFVLGNLLTAILVRNELFGRFLYLIINALFAKVGVHVDLLHWQNELTSNCSGHLSGGA